MILSNLVRHDWTQLEATRPLEASSADSTGCDLETTDGNTTTDDRYDDVKPEEFHLVEALYRDILTRDLSRSIAVIKAASNVNEPSVGELQQRSEANNELIAAAFDQQAAPFDSSVIVTSETRRGEENQQQRGRKFIKLPDVCVGFFQSERFRHDKNETGELEPFFIQLVRPEVDGLYEQLEALRNRYFVKKSQDRLWRRQQSDVILECLSVLTSRNLHVISIIDQTSSIGLEDKDVLAFVTKTLTDRTSCLFSGSADNDFDCLKSPFDTFDKTILPVRVNLEQMKLLVHQFYPRIAANEIERSKSKLELCHNITGGCLLEISAFCQIDAGDDLQQRFVRYRDNYRARFNPESVGHFLNKEPELACLRREHIKDALASALLDEPLNNLSGSFDKRFLFPVTLAKRHQDDNDIRQRHRAKFITPCSIESVLSYYTSKENGTKFLDLVNSFNCCLANATRSSQIRLNILTRLRLIHASSPEYQQPITFDVWTKRKNQEPVKTAVQFCDFDIVDVRNGLTIDPVIKNCLLLPVEHDHPAFDLYYYACNEKALFLIQVTIPQDEDMCQKLSEFDKIREETSRKMCKSLVENDRFYIIYMCLQAFSESLTTRFEELNYAYLENLPFNEHVSYIKALRDIAAQNKSKSQLCQPDC